MRLSIQIAKFKFRQYQMRAILPILMFTKVIRYTVHLELGCDYDIYIESLTYININMH